jgi:hypothetical protein
MTTSGSWAEHLIVVNNTLDLYMRKQHITIDRSRLALGMRTHHTAL